VLVHGYLAWGDALIHKLDGFFAFLIWDRKAEHFVLARDRLGKKPLYYTQTPDGFLLFASEIQAIVKGVEKTPDLNSEAIEDYFSFGYVPDPKTIFEGIHKLPPAHAVTWDRKIDGIKLPPLTRYWQIKFDPQPHRSNMNELVKELEAHLYQAVQKRLDADVLLGSFLSGGIDSGGITAFMARASGASTPIHTCTMTFPQTTVDESEAARAVATLYNTHHHESRIEEDPTQLISTLAHIYGEPFADASALPTYLICKAAKNYMTVALSGDGGDEVFAGYRRYPFHMAEEKTKRFIPKGLQTHLIAPLARLYPQSGQLPRFLRLKATLESLSLDWVGGYFRAITICPDAIREKLYTRSFRKTLNGYHAKEVIALAGRGTEGLSPLSRAQMVDFATWLPGRMLVKTDRASMASGIEIRSPLLDIPLLEWAAGLSDSTKIQRFTGKKLLRQTLSPYLPPASTTKAKQGFVAPIDEWMRSHPTICQHLETLTTRSRLLDSGYISQPMIASLLKLHQDGKADHSRILWACLMFGEFLNNL
jgi:asparagine synthase (glutamine-hydrolysing)